MPFTEIQRRLLRVRPRRGGGYASYFGGDAAAVEAAIADIMIVRGSTGRAGRMEALEFLHDHLDAFGLVQSGAAGGASFTPTHWIEAGASGSGIGTESNPFTLQQAIGLAQPGWRLKIGPGDYIGPVTNDNWNGSFSINRAGTAEQPIIWFAENYASLSTAGRTRLRYPGVAPSACNPVLSVHAPHNHVFGLEFDERYAIPGRDTGTVTVTRPNVHIRYCIFDRQLQAFSGYGSHTNLAGLRIEPSLSGGDVAGVVVADNIFRNYRPVSGGGSQGCSPIMVFSIQNPYTRNLTIEHNYGENNLLLCYIKGAGTPRPILGGMIWRRNVSRIIDELGNANNYHVNMSDTNMNFGRNQLYLNVFMGGRMVVRPHAQTPPFDTLGVDLINNTCIDIANTSEDAIFRPLYQNPSMTPTWRMHNNLVYSRTRMFSAGEGQSDGPMLSRDHNMRYYHTGTQPSWQYTSANGNESRAQLAARRGHDINSMDGVNPLLVSREWGQPGFAHLQSASPARNAGVDILDLRGGGTGSPINIGAFISADMSDEIGPRAI